MSTAWPHGTQLPPNPLHTPGKLATSSATDRSLEVNPSKVQTVTPETIVYASPVMPMSGYRLSGSVDGVNISLLLDTGAAVTLLRADTWSQVATKTEQGLQPWSMARLVSAGGTPLTVHGCARVDLMFGPEKFVTEIVVVSPLTSEAILGLDFLMEQQASIDLTSKTLHLRERGCNIPLQDPTKPLETTDMFPVHAAMTVEVPPRSTLQVAGSIPNTVGGAWLLEEATNKHLPFVVARALVEPTSTTVPVCILNLSEDPVTVHAGMLIATLQTVTVPAVGLDSVGGGETAGIRLDSVCGGETAGVRLNSVCGGETAGVRLDLVGGGETAGVRLDLVCGGETAGVRLDSVGGGETAGVRLDSVGGGETAGVRVDSVGGGETAGVGMEKQELLWSIVENSGADLSSGEKDVFYHLLLSYADVLACSTSDLGRTDRLQHHIYTGDAAPVRQPVRRVSPHRREEVRQLLQEMLANGVIEPSTSPWASPIVLVQKKDGSMRFCVDYRKVNDVTQKDAYPLPRIDTTLDTLHGSQWFSTLDLLSGYWQVEVAKSDRLKTAFCATEGLFQFRVMPFGLCNAPATFQRLMDLVLAGLQWSECLVYLDDVIVLGRTFDEHLCNLQSVFQRLREAGLRLKPSKCFFFQRQVQYLGHIISREGIATDPAKTERVSTWPTPSSKRETQRFLGFASYYRRFVKDFARIARPLHRLTERTASFVWTDECRDAFNELCQSLCSAPVLAYPDFSRPFVLDTDASDVGIGAVLSQVDGEGRERVIAYGSRLLSKAERKYCVTHRELLAVVAFTQQYRPYLLGRKFQLRTDHGSLTWLRNFREPEGQLARWLERLQELDFDIVHRRGKVHTNADALSRLPCRQCGRDSHVSLACADVASTSLLQPLQGQLSDSLRDTQLADPMLGPLMRGKETGEEPSPKELGSVSRSSRGLLQLWEQLTLHQGILCRTFESPNGLSSALQIVIPTALRKEVLSDLHEGVVGGHLGIDKTLARLKERYYWPGHFNDVRDWCMNCGTCAVRKSPSPKSKAPLQSVVTGYPLQMVAMDIVGPFPESLAGNTFVLVVADYFTRWTEAYPIPNQEATTVAKKLVDQFFFRFSPPEQLHSDQGRNFESEVITEVCKLLGVVKSRTTPYHPQSDGLIERFNRTLLDMLAKAARERPFHWEEHLPRLCLAYNSSVHPTTGFAPFYLMFGRQVRMPVDLMYGNPNSHTATVPQYVASLRSSLRAAYDQVRNTMTTRLSRQKDLYDRRAHGEPFSSGDLVWLHTPAVPRGHSKKLHCPWTGPYRVVSRLSDAVYRIQHSQLRRKRLVVHFDRLKPCSPDTRLTTSARRSRAAPSLLPDAPVGTDLELLADDPNVGADVDQGQLHAAQDVPDPGGGVAMAPDTVAPSMQSGDMVTPAAVNNDHPEA